MTINKADLDWALGILGYNFLLTPTETMHFMEANRGDEAFVFNLAQIMVKYVPPHLLYDTFRAHSPKLGTSMDTLAKTHKRGVRELVKMYLQEVIEDEKQNS